MKREDLLKQMISEYRKKIEMYQSMIHEWEKELGVPSSTAMGRKTPAFTDTKATVDIQTWEFLGKSQPEAAKALLTKVGHPLPTEEIIEGIRKGGVEVGTSKYGFYSILNRSDDFALAKKNTWGLSEWPGMRKKKKRAKKNRSESK